MPDEVSVGANIFISETFHIKDTFNRESSKLLPDDHLAMKVDFSASSSAADKINDWISANTAGKIEKMISQDDLDHRTRMIVASAIVFKGQWKKPCRPGPGTRPDGKNLFGKPFDGVFGVGKEHVKYIRANEEGRILF